MWISVQVLHAPCVHFRTGIFSQHNWRRKPCAGDHPALGNHVLYDEHRNTENTNDSNPRSDRNRDKRRVLERIRNYLLHRIACTHHTSSCLSSWEVSAMLDLQYNLNSRDILKWREESDTYLTHVCRHRWSRKILMKLDRIGTFNQHCGFHQLYNQIGVALSPLF